MERTEVSAEQAQAAKNLVNIAGAHGAILDLAAELPPEILAKIKAAHEEKTADMCCAAHCEGLWCCIDILLFDPADYAAEKVTEAGKLLHRYYEQSPEQA